MPLQQDQMMQRVAYSISELIKNWLCIRMIILYVVGFYALNIGLLQPG